MEPLTHQRGDGRNEVSYYFNRFANTDELIGATHDTARPHRNDTATDNPLPYHTRRRRFCA